MFEARLIQGALFKKIIESIRELVKDANIDCSESGLSMQAMDSSHVALVALVLRSDGFDHYRCDRALSLGLQLESLGKVLRCAGSDDILTIKAEDAGEKLTLIFESESQDRISDFELGLMDIDSEHLGIPEQEYTATVKMPSSEFQRIIRDLQILGDTCTVSVTKEGVKFSTGGDIGQGNVMLRPTASAEKEDDEVTIQMEEPVELTFALRYLNLFTKATPLGGHMTLSMSPDVPVVVEYPICVDKGGEGVGHVRYYLAPKIDEEEE
jgi:proliferating cell nuclear antigen